MQKGREVEVCKGVLVEEEDWPWHRGLSIGSSEGVESRNEKENEKHVSQLFVV